jgi:hypothetical protein
MLGGRAVQIILAILLNKTLTVTSQPTDSGSSPKGLVRSHAHACSFELWKSYFQQIGRINKNVLLTICLVVAACSDP